MYLKLVCILLLSLNIFSSENVNPPINIDYHTINIPKKTLSMFGQKYRKNALKRLDSINKILTQYKDKSISSKLHAVNYLVNKLNFSQDLIHWKKENYWATPLEFIGTGIGDTNDFALLKLLLLVKLNIDSSKLKLIKKSTPLRMNGLLIKKNIALAYFHNKTDAPIILEYKKNRSKIYRYKKVFTYSIINHKEDNYIDDVIYGNISIFNVDQLFQIFK